MIKAIQTKLQDFRGEENIEFLDPHYTITSDSLHRL
jgi:hypothetical protein